jgi:hypothetical protein
MGQGGQDQGKKGSSGLRNFELRGAEGDALRQREILRIRLGSAALSGRP